MFGYFKKVNKSSAERHSGESKACRFFRSPRSLLARIMAVIIGPTGEFRSCAPKVDALLPSFSNYPAVYLNLAAGCCR